MNIYEQISSNKRKTFVIMLGFIIFISSLGYIFGEVWLGQGAGISIMVFALIFSSFAAFFSYFFSDKAVLALAHAKKVNREASPMVYGILENLCIGAGIKKVPDLYLLDDTAINAFATGRDPDHAVVAVTTGAIDRLTKRELEAVLAHELSHIRNYDIRLMTIVVVLVGSVSIMANIMLRSRISGGDKKSVGGWIVLIGFLLALLSPIIAQLIKLAVSRSREYLADASGALLTRDPQCLASALEKIAADTEPLEVANEATAHLYISNPFKKGNKVMFANLFSTHPSVEERIRRLRSM